MKRRAFIKRAGLFLPVFPAMLHAQVMPGARHAAARLPVAAGEGELTYTLKDSVNDGVTAITFGRFAADKYLCGTFVAGSTYDIRRFSANLLKVGSPTCTITAYLWSLNGSSLAETLVATSQNTISGGDVTASSAWYNFNFGAGTTLSSGTTYALGFGVSAVDSGNYLRTRGQASVGPTVQRRTGDTGAFNVTLADYQMNYETYSAS